jgi:hypothetical protein
MSNSPSLTTGVGKAEASVPVAQLSTNLSRRLSFSRFSLTDEMRQRRYWMPYLSRARR